MDLRHPYLLWTDILASHPCAEMLLLDADAVDAIGAWSYLAWETIGQADEAERDQFSEDLHIYGDEEKCWVMHYMPREI